MTSIPLSSRQIIISSHDEGPLVNIVSWIGLSTMILGVGARIGSKYLVVRRCSTDDGLIIVAMCFGICHSVFLSMMVNNGLGRYQDTLNSKELEYYQKYAYASQLVYIPTLCFAKLSTLFYLRALTPDSNYAILNRVTEVCVILWALCAEVSVAFQCDLPNPWAVLSTDECFNIGVFWQTIGALDIVTDSGIIFMPIFLVWGLQMPLRRKALVFMAFGTRMFILPLSIMRLVIISSSAAPTLPNQTLVSYRNYVWTSVQLNSAIFFACLSFLKPFMESMSSGGLAASVNAMDSSYGNNHSQSNSKLSTFLSSRSGLKSSKKNRPRIPQDLRTISTFQDYDEDDEISTRTASSPVSNFKKSSPMFNFRLNNTNTDAKPSHEGEELGTLRPDGALNVAHIRRSTPVDNADRSTVGSDKMIIRRTTEWDVKEDFENFERRNTRSGDGDDYEIHKASMEERDGEVWGERGIHYIG
ncbi:1e6bd8fd-17e8-4b98-b7a7-6bab7964e67e [Sclerotinia trifoliorum]|uniref:1e6bd8fd-17e8-4b98-b7a7-6bab7964e67e n=1 Tax=Sclerotinia trifoliorum TaxID=28548 RepID=A0A8H2VYX4_9HELO|nr:1e6bd8fd-17e8-4b98-b7a7-6bab7964e67e [Sclerotinia trifoliorum]